MRLAVASPFVDRRHGTERALAELLERLARDYDCEIHLYSQRVEELSLREPPFVSPERASGIVWHKLPSLPGPHLLQFLFWFYSNGLWRWTDKFLRGISFDLVLSPGINCADADVVIVHALFHRLRELSQESAESALRGLGFFRRLHRRAYYALLSRLERRSYSNPKVALAAVSSRTAGLLAKSFNRTDVVVIPNGVDTTQFSPSARLARRETVRARWQFQPNEFVLLLVGNDWGNKGLPALLEALSLLPQIPAKLLIVGDDEPAPFRAVAQRLGILNRCIWELPLTDILDVYAAADLYVSPSREDSFGMPVAEAMACGLPVITTVFAGISSLLHDGVDSFVLRDPSDAKILAERISMLYAKPELRIQTGRAAADVSRKWTWDRNAAAVWQFLKEVHTPKNSPTLRSQKQ